MTIRIATERGRSFGPGDERGVKDMRDERANDMRDMRDMRGESPRVSRATLVPHAISASRLSRLPGLSRHHAPSSKGVLR